MVRTMLRELTLRQSYLGGESVQTIYFGGGTPSMLSVDELAQFCQTVAKSFSLDNGAEVTLEANPDDLTQEKLKGLRSIGVNRLSIGIQSFSNRVLQYLNRSHDAPAAIRSFDDARSAGFGNISIDLIFAIPEQSDEMWRNDIAQALALEPDHISAYSLTIEKSTVFGNMLKRGKLFPLDDDVAAARMDVLATQLTARGYDHYEVSNFGKPGYYSRHNSSYWQRKKYLGIGPSAHSFDGRSRQFNVSNNHVYVKALREDRIPCEKEILSRSELVNDYLLTTLRTSWGCDLRVLKTEFDYDIVTKNRDYVARLVAERLADLDGNCLKLTGKGKLLADRISSDLFLIGD